ncbi:MAG: NAD-dependent epimerase/dehydratase family protein [bacterium]
MKVVVTGAAGFIGSHLTDALLARGDTVVGVDSFAPNYSRSIKERNLASAIDSDGFELIEGDLRELDLVDLLEGADGLVHLAAFTDARGGESDLPEYERLNVDLPRRLLVAAHGAGVGSILLASSSAVYGGAREDGSPSTELDPLEPIAPYGQSKAEMEQVADDAAAGGVPVACLRFFTVYGSRQRPDMPRAPAHAAATRGPPLPLLGDGTQRRAWVHVGDAVASILAALATDLAPGTVLNIGSRDSHAVSELIDLIAELTGHEVRIESLAAHPADPAATIADISRAAELLGWKPKVDLQKGLEEQVAWARGL